MRRCILLLCVAAVLLSLCACGKKTQSFYPTPEDVTIESIRERTTPQLMLGFEGGFQIDWRNEDEGNAGAYASTTSMRYRYDGEKVLFGQMADYDNGEYTHIYFTSDLNEPVMFVDDDREDGIQVTPLTDRETQNALTESLFGLDYYDCEITSCTKTADGYLLGYDANMEDRMIQHVDMDIDPVRGMVTGAVIYYYDYGVQAGMSTVTITYSRNVHIDDSPRTQAIEQGLYDPEQAQTQTEESQSGGFNFACADLDGTLRTMKDYEDSALILICFWEPENAESVDELAELQKLYSDYKDTVTVLGAYTSTDEDAVRKAVKDAGAAFPILRCDNHLSLYRNEPLPSTILVSGLGELLSEEPFFGVIGYNEWETAISSIQSAASTASGSE